MGCFLELQEIARNPDEVAKEVFSGDSRTDAVTEDDLYYIELAEREHANGETVIRNKDFKPV